MITITVPTMHCILHVKDVELFSEQYLAYRDPRDLDTWEEMMLPVQYAVEPIAEIIGNLRIELCDVGPADPFAYYDTDYITLWPEGIRFGVGNAAQEMSLAWYCADHLFVAERE